jgi:GNAT superfamily N-acetyltransferase
LANLGAAHIGQGWFVPSSHIRQFADGGVLIEPASLAPIAQVTDEFLDALARHVAPSPIPVRFDSPGGQRVSPVAGAPDLQVHRVAVGDPRLEPLLADLIVEYGTRYGRPSEYTQLTEVPRSDFLHPDGAFLILQENGVTVAGGALRRYDAVTAEVKRVWTSHRHRRRGLARRVMAELEAAALGLGYTRIHLTTGPRQPEARNLYLEAGYTPRFDIAADPETIGPLAFGKELVTGAGLAQWRQPTWDEVEQARRRRAEPGPAQSRTEPAAIGEREHNGDAGPLLRRIAHQQSELDIDERRHVHARSVNGSHR